MRATRPAHYPDMCEAQLSRRTSRVAASARVAARRGDAQMRPSATGGARVRTKSRPAGHPWRCVPDERSFRGGRAHQVYRRLVMSTGVEDSARAAELPVSPRYKRHLLQHIATGLSAATAAALLLLAAGPGWARELVLGVLPVLVACATALTAQFITPWRYVADRERLYLQRGYVVRALDAFRWDRDGPTLVEEAVWRGLPALRVTTVAGRSMLLVYAPENREKADNIRAQLAALSTGAGLRCSKSR